jgi:hypothetical protein
MLRRIGNSVCQPEGPFWSEKNLGLVLQQQLVQGATSTLVCMGHAAFVPKLHLEDAAASFVYVGPMLNGGAALSGASALQRPQ